MKVLCLMRRFRSGQAPVGKKEESVWVTDTALARAALGQLEKLGNLREGEGSHWVEERQIPDMSSAKGYPPVNRAH